MKFQLQDRVVVKSLSKQGVIVEIARDGRLKVAVGSLTLTCTVDEIRLLSESEVKQREKFPEQSGWTFQGTVPSMRTLSQPLDLHGYSSAEATELVERRIDEASRAGIDRIQILHGLGSGVVQKAVHDLLQRLPTVAHFKLAEANPGITWAYLK